MKHLFLRAILFTLLSISFISCEEEEEIIELTTSVTFWSDFAGPPISVTITSVGTGNVTAINTSTPDCFETGNYTRTLNPGTYNYFASDGNLIWDRSFTISGNASCTTVLLTD